MDDVDLTADRGGSFLLRLGVLMPDWSGVTDPSACGALSAIMAAAGRAEKWVDLDPAEDRVWQAILRGFAATGRAPDTLSLSAATRLDDAVVSRWLHSLRQRDLIVLGSDGAVTAAYPFCAWETEHHIDFGTLTVNSLCAIDTLGAGAMVGRDTVIESSCPECGTKIRLATRNNGYALDMVTPATTIVWSGLRYADNCAATSDCTVKRFFCSDAHLASWRQRVDPKGSGFRLSMDAAFQVGQALFVPMLAESPVSVAARSGSRSPSCCSE